MYNYVIHLGERMKLKIIVALLATLLLTGCNSPFGPDKEGWQNSQKSEFLSILKNDTYMSLCNQKRLYEHVKSSRNSKLMSQLLIAYANNLANGCIDLASFEASQRAKKENNIETFYATYKEHVDSNIIKRKLRAGLHISQILKPYVPTMPQFKALVSKYKAFTATKDNNITYTQLRKIRLNIERAKLMNPNMGKNYALINIPEFVVRIIENNKTVMKFPVIVGKTNMQTPVFSEKMKYVEINPQWNVPDSIMRKSYIDKIKRNPEWVKARGMELHKESYDLKSPTVDPSSVDWSEYPKDKKGYIPYKLVQVPSLKNGLGRVKFIFPNSHAVYMHDTQGRTLFKRKVRAFSHGCIRLSKPHELLNHITQNYSNKSIEMVQKWYDSMKTRHLILNRPLAVHTAYFTAYVDELGDLRLFNDIYGFDKSQKLNFPL